MLLLYLFYATIGVLLYYLYQYGTKNENFFVERGIKHHKPTFFFGNILKPVIKQISIFDHMKNFGRAFPGEKLVGFFEFRDPAVLVMDPELLKVLTVKEFDSFVDHKTLITEESDPVFGNNLFFLRGQKWKDMRAITSPAFTGSKMRYMCEFMVETCEQMVEYLKNEASQKGGPQIHEIKDLFTRLTADIIGSCAFGVKVDSLKDANNSFYVTAKQKFNFNNPALQMKFMLIRMAPKLAQALKIQLIPENDMKFLKHLVVDTMKIREEQKIIRPDMIHLMMEAKKGNLSHDHVGGDKDSAGFATVEEASIGVATTRRPWKDEEVIAQCYQFFIAGFETIASILTFVIYEIMVNPDVQEKLYWETKETHDNLNGKSITYEQIRDLKYLDMVISEVLRKWSPAPFIDRVCNKDYTLKYDGKEYTFHKGDLFFLPIICLHHNPEYFPNPDKFDPERFSDENKDQIKSGTFIPFGMGPRNCIGSRFALLELKAIVYHMVLNFNIEVTPKSQIPLKLAKSMIALQSERGVHSQFRPRN